MLDAGMSAVCLVCEIPSSHLSGCRNCHGAMVQERRAPSPRWLERGSGMCTISPSFQPCSLHWESEPVLSHSSVLPSLPSRSE